MDGWIKLHRSIQEHWVWKDFPYSEGQAWIDLLLLANHEDRKIPYKGEIIICERGTVNRSISSLANRWRWGRKKATNFLHLLETDGMISLKCTTNRTTITIENYGLYQDLGTTKGTTSDTTREQRGNTNKKDKNDKNILPKGNIGNFVPPTLDDVKEYCQERGNKVDCQRWYDFYSSKGWMIGKNKMKDWKAAVRTWERADNNRKVVVQKKNDFNNFSTTANYDMDELERKLLGG